ncbi:toll/interleukin-1 receptor domain-containing protein [Erythrobacter sp. HA6-11]
MSARVFISYSHVDEELRDQLEVQLAMLKRQGLVELWHDRGMLPGDHLDWTISKELDEADIILLLVSPDFLASDYCYKIEKGRALQRHRSGEARLISVIMRPCDWTYTDLSDFLVTPRDGKPVTMWPDRDEAFLDVAQSIRRAIEELGKAENPKQTHDYIERTAAVATDETPPLPRSSNLRLRKAFSKADKDDFLIEAFEYADRFFQGSLDELEKRNEGIETRHRRIDGNTFTATIYQSGEKAASCTVRQGGMTNGIDYADGDDARPGTSNESMLVEYDDQKMYLRPLGLGMIGHGHGREEVALSHEGAAEYLWSILIRRLQE